jgi:hypothetical protein
MKKIFIVFISVALCCAGILFFYDIDVDTTQGLVNISSKTGNGPIKSFDYRKKAVIRNFVDALHDISIATVDKTMSKGAEETAVAFLGGERLIYDVYYAGLKAGESVLTFHGERDLGNQKAYYITFSTELPFLKDYEEIYACKDTFLPLKINRRIIKLGGLSREHIEEVYDQKNFTVTITKDKKNPENSMIIQKNGPIYNAILLTYYYRANPDIRKRRDFEIVLPTQEFKIRISRQDDIETPSGKYLVDVFTSEPSKFTFYLSKDSRRLPVKITSHTALNYALVLKEKDGLN